jgi:hypothetical protein
MRLQAIAEPNTVVIAESTRKLLGNLFELEHLGAKDLRGIAGPPRRRLRSEISFCRSLLTHTAVPRRGRQRWTCRRSSTLAKAKPAREVVVGLIASELHLVYLFG